MNLYISDLHFGHKNAIRFDHRPFMDCDEMDHMLIELWNGRVQPDDTVYIVGDLCYRNSHPPEWYLRQLKGHKILILGNHDWKLPDNPAAVHYLEGVEHLIQIKDGDNQIVLCHYPLAEWNGCFHGSWHIYGHIHNTRNETYDYIRTKERALNAGCMINNYTPASFKELVRNNEVYKKA